MDFFENKGHWWPLIKDALFLLLAGILLVEGGFFGFLLGLVMACWYGRDLVGRVRLLRRSKASDPASAQKEPAPDGGRIKITDLSDVKEVQVEKES